MKVIIIIPLHDILFSRRKIWMFSFKHFSTRPLACISPNNHVISTMLCDVFSLMWMSYNVMISSSFMYITDVCTFTLNALTLQSTLMCDYPFRKWRERKRNSRKRKSITFLQISFFGLLELSVVVALPFFFSTEVIELITLLYYTLSLAGWLVLVFVDSDGSADVYWPYYK